MKKLLLIAPVAAFVVAAPAAAHERHGLAAGSVSTVATIDPNVVGLGAFVVGGDDRVLVRNLSGRTGSRLRSSASSATCRHRRSRRRRPTKTTAHRGL